MTVRATLFDATGADQEIDLEPGGSLPSIGDDQLLWIDLDSRDDADIDRLVEALDLEPRAAHRLRHEDHRTRLLRLTDRIVLTLGVVESGDAQAHRRELDIVVGRNVVVTVHEGALGAIDEFREHMSHDGMLGRMDAWAFTAGLIDSAMAIYFRHVEAIEQDIDQLDQLALTSRAPGAFLDAVVALRGRIARLRRALVPNREALFPLARPDFETHENRQQVWPGTLERLERAIDSVENARELLVGSFDIYLGQSGHRSNEVMKILTIVSAIALPAIVLAGVMGMNFEIAFFENPDNYWIVLAAMIVFSVTIVVLARWRRWF